MHILALKVVISKCAIRTFWVYFLLSARTDPCLEINLALVKAVYYAKLRLWVVIKAVLEVVVNVDGLPVHTGGPFEVVVRHSLVTWLPWTF